MKLAGRAVIWQGARSDLADALAPFVMEGDVVITIGAGDITRTGPELKTRLEGRSTEVEPKPREEGKGTASKPKTRRKGAK
jgi:hypothetical protein